MVGESQAVVAAILVGFAARNQDATAAPLEIYAHGARREARTCAGACREELKHPLPHGNCWSTAT